MAEDKWIILLDMNDSNKEIMEQILSKDSTVSHIELITNPKELKNISAFADYRAILINEEVEWLDVSEFLKQLSNDSPSIARIVFSTNKAINIINTEDSNLFDGAIGNFSETYPLLDSILSFALERAKERINYRTLQEDYGSLIDTTPIGFFRTTEDGKILLFNPALMHLFEYENAEAMSNVQIEDLYYDSSRRKLILENFRQKGYHFSQQEKMKKKSGEAFWVSMHARTVFDENNQIRYYEGSIIDVTKQKELDLQLRQEKEQYQKLFETTGTGICVVNEDSTIELCNNQFEEIVGYSKVEIENKRKWSDFIPESERKRLSELSSNLRQNSNFKHRQFETRLINKEGRAREVLVFLDFNPEKKQSISSIIDITETKEIERELIESEERYRGFVENFDGIAYSGNLDSKNIVQKDNLSFIPIFFQGKVREITGFSEADFLSGSVKWNEIIHKEDLDGLQDSFEKIATVPNYRVIREYRIIPLDGQIKWIREHIRNIVDQEGNLMSYQGTLYDITSRKIAEEELKGVEEIYRKAKEIAQTGEFEFDFKTKKFHSSKEINQVLGFDSSFEGLSDEDLLEFVHQEDRIKIVENISQAIEENLPIALDFRIIRSLKTVKHVYMRAEISYDEEKNPERILGMIQDITIRRKTELELLDQELKFKQIFDSSNDCIILHDLHGNLKEVNQQAIKQFGHSKNELLQMNVSHLHPESALDYSKEAFKQVLETSFANFEIEFKRKDGSLFPAEVTSSIFEFKGQKIIQGIVRDITEKKHAELESSNAFNQIEKNLEQFAVLVDSIRNPLAVIVGLVDSYGKEEKEIVIKHAKLIDDIITHIDERSLESEEVRKFLKKHFD
ncbi:MAG: PAS domain S-box protein [Candidatus Heimdallarchaeota archaeon]|nr:PAS domain S-box protein [Candidatus Heimdallarchaeota archaeon]